MGYNAKNWLSLLRSNGRVQLWTDCCGRLMQRVLQIGTCTEAVENAQPARARNLTPLKSLF